MRRCTVSIVGKDGQTHTSEVDATSLFDAAETVMRDWNRLWWWSSSSMIQIESGPDRWQVNQAKVREWRQIKPVS
jgi:hypothetical protein